MAKHKVNFNLPDRPLSFADIVFTVKEDGKKFGELRISKGALVWFPRLSRKGYKMSWKKLDEVFQSQRGRRPKR